MNSPDEATGLAGVQAYWERKAAEESTDCARIESGRRAQKMRFENFVINHALEGATILDIGCGVGDFWEHLQTRGIACDYLGTDLSQNMIDRCRARFPAARFETVNICQAELAPVDYTVAFAIHNVRFAGGAELLHEVTRRQFELCTRAAHVSLLTDRFPGFDPHIQAWRAEEILTMALAITPYVVLRHDYLPNDFSVTLYRAPVIDTRRDLLLDRAPAS